MIKELVPIVVKKQTYMYATYTKIITIVSGVVLTDMEKVNE